MVKQEITQRRPARAMNSRTNDKNDSDMTKSRNNNGVKKGRVVTPPKVLSKTNFIHIVFEMLSSCSFRYK